MTVYETTIPGVGRKYELEISGDERLAVVVHNDSRRDVYRRSKRGENEKLFGLSGAEARRLGSILEGAYFQPVELDALDVPLGDAIIEWYELPEDATLVGSSLAEADVWGETGATVIAVQRGSETHPSPNPEFDLRAGDVLVAVGSREEQAALSELVRGE
ncbi:cation:proton antiporter regulatory subunit [Halorussus halophilus]|uniref:cation:proton antiporter regulatory subunit n=1 Tax=Halorussus halophilus TaxID=2650975 RepID=UPI001300F6C2|nr:cation:proton antiporter regulatory subunit [Halorussus halophilus]